MSKRFTDDGKWDRPWFRELEPIRKLVFVYLLDKCNRAGFWEIDTTRMWFDLNITDPDKVLAGLSKDPWKGLKDVVVSGKWLMIVDFISFQYPKGLQVRNPAHKFVFEFLDKMEKMKLFKELPRVSQDPMDMDKDMGMDKDKETAKELGKLFCDQVSKGYNRTLTTSQVATSQAILKLLKRGIQSEQIRQSINWLATVNQQREYKFVVLSGQSLFEKWDRIQEAMYGKAKSSKQQRYLVED